MHRTLIAALLVVSAIGELLGTLTVAINYGKGARLAEHIRLELSEESTELQRNPATAFLKAEGPAYFEHIEVKTHIAALRARVADQLSAATYLTIGLVALAVGALTGLGAGLLALY
jgi:hypothetical protein